MQGATARQALVTSYSGIELFWYPLNLASVKGFSPAAWDPYADRLMVYMMQRAGGASPQQYSDRPNLLANLETALGALGTQVGQQTGSQAVQVTPELYPHAAGCSANGLTVAATGPYDMHQGAFMAASIRAAGGLGPELLGLPCPGGSRCKLPEPPSGWPLRSPRMTGARRLDTRGPRARQVAAQRVVVQTQQSLLNVPGLKTLPAAIHYGRHAIDQFRVYDFEMTFRVDPDFRVPFDAWNAGVAVVKEALVAHGRRAL